MFTGEYNHTIDQKGRLIIPNKFRNLLGETFVVTKGVDECLEVYDKKTWDVFAEKINSLPYSNPAARKFKRKFIGPALELSPDKMGRIQLNVAIREAGNLKSEITFVGVGDHIEIWNTEVYKKKYEYIDSDEMSKEMEGLGI